MFIQEKTISKRAYNKKTLQKKRIPKKRNKNTVSGVEATPSGAVTKTVHKNTQRPRALILSPRSVRFAVALAIAVVALTLCAVSAAYVGSVLTTFKPEKATTLSGYSSYNRAFLGYEPTFNVTVDLGDGNVIVSNLPQLTVGEIIDSLDVEVGSEDVLSIPLDEVISDDVTIELQKTTYKEVTISEKIPYSTKYVDSQNVPKGKQKVVTAGEYGVSTRVLKQKYVGGELVSETVVSESITKKPVDKVVATGVGGTFVGSDGKTYSYSYYVDVKATAYTGNGVTASGKPTGTGTIAVDQNVIPLGSKTYVTGKYGDYGVCYANDVGSGVKGNNIDIWLPTEEECIRFGIRYMTIYVLE